MSGGLIISALSAAISPSMRIRARRIFAGALLTKSVRRPARSPLRPLRLTFRHCAAAEHASGA